MQEPQFIGVYATNEMPSTLGASHRPMVKRKRLWFVWELEDGKYKVQPLNAIHAPMAEPRLISGREFTHRFVEEPNCYAVPERFVPEGQEGEQPAPESEAPTVEETAEADTPIPQELRADDPNLLQFWLAEDSQDKPVHSSEVSPAQEAEMTRLLGDPMQESSLLKDADGPLLMPGALPPVRRDDSAAAPLAPIDPEQALRAQFALALLQLKQERREEGVANLEHMLIQPYDLFPGAAMTFSEIGLSLRRLGMINLALLAHQRALEFAPDDERVHFNLARGYHDMNKFVMARAHLERALEIAPDFTAAQQFLTFLKTKAPASL